MTEEKQEETPPQLYDRIDKIFEKFDEKEARLDTIPDRTSKAVETLMNAFDDKKNIFEEPEKFRRKFDVLARAMGHVHHIVMTVELQRERLKQPFEGFGEKLQGQLPMNLQLPKEEKPSPPVVVNTGTGEQENRGIGFYGWRAEVARQKTLQKALAKAETPQMTSETKPKDILDYCKDVTVECNKFYNYYQQSLDHLHFYPDENTIYFYQSAIRAHLGKLCNVIVSFTTTIVEYRKDLNIERQVLYGQAVAMMEQARAIMQMQGGGKPLLDPLAVAIMQQQAAKR